MAKNREPEKHVDPDTESDEEEDEEEDTSDEVESESDPERYQVAMKPQLLSSQKAKQPNSSEEEEDEESGSDSEPVTGEHGRNVKPVASNPPMDGPQKSMPKGKAADPSTPVKSTGEKRSAVEEKDAVEKESKTAKKKSEPENADKKSNGPSDSSKKLLFQRLWSEEDEIVILKGMLDYIAKFNSNPSTDLDAFHDFIRKNLHVDVSKSQLQDKMRRLKKKFVNNKTKGKEGKNRNFSKAHEQKAYELSNKIWGSVTGQANENGKAIGSTTQNNKRALVENDMQVRHDDLDKPFVAKRVCSNCLSGHDRILSIGTELFERDDMVEGQNEWKKLMEEGIEIHLKELDLMRAQTKLVLDVVKSKNN